MNSGKGIAILVKIANFCNEATKYRQFNKLIARKIQTLGKMR